MATKKDNLTPYLIGGAILGGLYLFRKQIKGLFNKDEEPETETIDNEPVKQPAAITTITPSGVTQTPAGITKGLHGIGTPKNKLNMSQTLQPGDKGQEVAKLQQILNRVAKIYGTATIKETGVFDTGTEAKLTKIYGFPKINLYNAYSMLYAIFASKKNLKNWYKTFQSYSNPTIRGAAKVNYFKTNTIL